MEEQTFVCYDCVGDKKTEEPCELRLEGDGIVPTNCPWGDKANWLKKEEDTVNIN